MSKKIVKIELANPRYSKADIRDHASEFILYSRYSGYVLEDFNNHLRGAKLVPIKSDFNDLYKLVLETTLDNAKVLYQLTKLYPSFGNWKLKCLTPGVDIATFVFKPVAEKKKSKQVSAAKSQSAPKSSKKPNVPTAPKKAAVKPAKKVGSKPSSSSKKSNPPPAPKKAAAKKSSNKKR